MDKTVRVKILNDLLDDSVVITERMESTLQNSMVLLTPQEHEIINLCYNEEKSAMEIGVLFGLTRERIRRIKTRALRTLRKELMKV